MSNENLSPNSSNPDLTKLNNGESGTIDTSKFSPNEMKLYKMYGKLPSKKDIFKHTMQKRKISTVVITLCRKLAFKTMIQ